MKQVSALVILLLGVAVNAGVIQSPKVFQEESFVNDANPEEGEYFEGDIMGVELDARGAVRVPTGQWRRWSNGIIPYLITTDNSYTPAQRDTMLLAMRTMEEKTRRDDGRECIKFVPRTNQLNYIRIVNGSGCSSNVGQLGIAGPQNVSLMHRPGGTCITLGIVMHELLHALGSWHEQSRPDRDNYVRINYQNIPAANQHNFNKYTTSEVTELDITYDYGSIMHYGATSFSNNGQPTITPLQAGVEIGQRRELSRWDIEEIKRMYCR